MKNQKITMVLVSILLIGSNVLGSNPGVRKNMWQGALLSQPSLPKIDVAAIADAHDFLQSMGNYAESPLLDNQLLQEIRGAGDVAKVSELLQAGADPNAQDEHEETALNYAVMYNRPEIARLLLFAGATPDWSVVYLDEWYRVSGVDRDYDDDFGDNYEKLWKDRELVMGIVRDFKDLKFKPISKSFDKEPEPMDYVDETASSEDQITEEEAIELFASHIERFYKDLTDYWRNKLQKAYKPYLQGDPRPLIDFFSKDMYERPGLLFLIGTMFNEALGITSDFGDVFSMHFFLERMLRNVDVKKVITEEEKARIEELASMEEERYEEWHRERGATKIQDAWKKYLSSANRSKAREAYKRRMDMTKLPFSQGDEGEWDLYL